ncbi:MAG: hypothetical protein EXR21_03600 [Flavobacteriaceae bacterium]|nr:hypothetical protein [Flavobacteriaceae bacterium]
MKKNLIIVSFAFCFSVKTNAQKIAGLEIGIEGMKWVDSVFRTMSPERRLGQLFMVADYSDPKQCLIDETECLIKEYGIGGICMFKGTPMRQATLVNYYQSISKVPIMISMDAEWGLAMRLDSTVSYPRQMAMGCVQNDSLIYHFGADVARQCRRLGVHFSFSPVVDVNNNPRNPVIIDRSFGEDRELVARKAIMYMRGLQDNKVLACAKHFPGHGNVETDSHLDLPVINCSKTELDNTELYPFKKLFDAGIGSVMVAHLSVPVLDSSLHTATSLSKNVVTKLLKQEMQFEGLAVTDGLEMKGVTKYFFPDSLNLRSLMAGNDVLLCANDVPGSVKYILDAAWKGWISMDQLDQKVKRFLGAKYWLGLNNYQPCDTTNLIEDLNLPSSYALRNDIAKNAIILLKNEHHLLPIPANKKLLLLNVGYSEQTKFEEAVSLFNKATVINIDKYKSDFYFDSIADLVHDFDVVVAAIHSTSRFLSKGYAFTPQAVRFLNSLPKKRTLYVHFGSLYSLDSFSGFHTIIAAHEDWEYYQTAAARLVCGSVSGKAKLSVTPTEEYTFGMGESFPAINSLDIRLPQEVGLDSRILKGIDSVCQMAIDSGATPGCQVFVSRNGKIIYNKSFGIHSYTDTTRVKISDLYDIASVTKILSTTLAVMKLYEAGKLKLDDKLSKYMKELRKTNKKDITLRQVLTHTAGLQEWIPFYKNTLRSYGPDSNIYKKQRHDGFQVQLTDSMWMHRSYQDSIWNNIRKSPVKKPGQYAYSDIGFILLKRTIEKISGEPFDKYTEEHFYKPLGLAKLCWKPLYHNPVSSIIPSEVDTEWRKTEVLGYVHDPAAAMLGGVSGHAGLFSNAFDVGVLMQMLINKGSYKNISLLKPATVDTFLSKQYGLRRGLGFDKAETVGGKPSPCSISASGETFGHQGFTGTCTWADPRTGLVYVFLSNRVNPSAGNKKLLNMNVRTGVQDVIYRSIIK